MKNGEITDTQYRNMMAEIKIKVGTKEKRYKIPMGVNEYSRLKELLRGTKECTFEEDKDGISKLMINGVYIDLTNTNKSSKNLQLSQNHHKTKPGGASKKMQDTNKPQKYAQAPYNFVPVNSKVVKAKNQESGIVISESSDGQLKYPEIPSFDRYHEGLYTGHIDLNIEALSPLYIRDAYNKDEEKRVVEAKAGGDKWENPDFFSPGGIPKIPGSSLRGMVRNLVEIVSYSQMEFVDDTTLYYRSVADECKSIREHYFDTMGQRGRNQSNPGYKFKAGYLQRDNNGYKIIPAKEIAGKQYERISPAKQLAFSFDWQADGPCAGSCITVSGPAPNGKNKDWLIYPVDNEVQPIKIMPWDLESYRNDINRYKDNNEKEKAEKRDGDLLRWLEVGEEKEDSEKMVPCFYIEWQDEKQKQHVSFGHTAYFRLPYRLSIKKHLPPAHQRDNEVLDFAKAIFGDADKFAGRVFFEDAKIDSCHQDKVTGKVVSPKILSNPKPTTFQHYLKQGNRTKDNLFHWDDKDAPLSGYKLYWHRKTPQSGDHGFGRLSDPGDRYNGKTPQSGDHGWEATPEEVEKAKTQYTKIKPINTGATFSGRIRFENLSDIELGALLFVLDLPEGCAHKIGMGKPLGLGSIKIQPTLVLSNRKERYQKLFDNNRWYLSEDEENEMQDFKNEFAGYMLCQLGKTEIDDPYKTYWHYDRIKDLGTMLDTSHAELETWTIDTEYMRIIPEQKINDFKERRVLPVPQQVVDSARKWSKGEKNDGRH